MNPECEMMTPERLRQLFDTYLIRAERIDEIAASLGLDDIGEGLRDTWFRLKQGPIRVLVTGCSSAGKSTLINALAGEIVVPEGKHTTSPIPVLIESRHAGDCSQVTLLRRDSPRLKQTGGYGLYRFLTDFCYTEAEAGRGASERDFSQIMSAHICVGSQLLADSCVTLIDTPGVGMSEGDDIRVKSILDGGCEFLIALFRDANIQQQHIKDYFCQLFVNDNAPLLPLLKNGRVFMVSNSGVCADINGQIAGRHLSADFGMDGSQLTVLNARYARIAGCGIYRYTNYLPECYSNESWEYAKKSTKEELSCMMYPSAERLLDNARDSLATLCESIRYAAEDFCADTDAVGALLTSVETPLAEAYTGLLSHLDVLRDRIKNADIEVPTELTERVDQATKRISELCMLEQTMRTVFGDPKAPFGISWPEESRVFDRAKDAADVALLITDDTPNAGAILRDLLLLGDAAAVTKKVAERIPIYQSACADLVHAYIADTLSSKIYAQLLPMNNTLSPILPDETLLLFGQENELQIKAIAAGNAAMEQAWKNTFMSDKKMRSTAYLTPLRTKIQNGGIGGGLSRLMLYTNYSVDILQYVIAYPAAEAGKLAFYRAYRDTLAAEQDTLYDVVRRVLTQALELAENEKKEAEGAVAAYIAAVKALKLALLDAFRKNMNDYIFGEGELPHYE